MKIQDIRKTLQTVPVARRLRVVLALTGERQQDVAVKVGMADPVLSRTIAGRREATDDEKRAIAKALGLSVSDLFGSEAA